MPEVVSAYVENRDFQEVRRLQRLILAEKDEINMIFAFESLMR